MKITIMLHNRNTRTFEDFEYNGDNHIHLVLDLFGNDVTDVYIYQSGTNIDNYKRRDPIVYRINRRQGYPVYNTLAWRKYYESNH
jgi:hypothetical protein